MDNLILILFICIALPLLLAMFLLEKKSRLIVLFIIIGMFTCMFVSQINGLIIAHSKETNFFIKTTYTPMSEEIIKAIPIIIFAFFVSSSREKLITIGVATGIGFAILENSYIIVSNFNSGSIDIFFAIIRAFGASLMHGICTASIGIGISFVHKKRKLFYTGTIALLITAMIYHGIFNALVLASKPLYNYLGYFLPIITYIPILVTLIIAKKNKSASK